MRGDSVIDIDPGTHYTVRGFQERFVPGKLTPDIREPSILYRQSNYEPHLFLADVPMDFSETVFPLD